MLFRISVRGSDSHRSLQEIAMRQFRSIGLLIALLAGSTARADQPVEMKVPAPELEGIADWINSKGFKLSDQRGKVLVLHFWTFG
jgi:hypothetical protein